MAESIWTGWWAESGWVIRAVFLVLVTLSILSWTVILAKFGRYAGILRAEQAATTLLDSERTNHALLNELRVHLPTRNLLASAMKIHQRTTVPVRERATMAAHLERWLGEQRLQLGNNLTFLATIGNSAPFIGLFGTVWGIMGALQTLGAVEALTIEAVAGPVGEALVATAAGLFTAIPAVIGYNLLVRWQNRIMATVAANAERIMDRVLAQEQQA
ncbi:MotA/TolQ/ExbB proton channel family protein [Thiohalorhabdus sp. Cl-TMA]|uniref:MotA/TolQ/ExbB proton channel family protein n=1 Tax=Thiohalorhabdus methylotrophus TaxID=3242694 RepID=A0ABV4TYY1_9GAMM